MTGGTKRTIWIDLSTAPDPLFFRPIVSRLRAEGYDTWTTARSYGETVPIADRCGLEVDVIGRHGGGSVRGKVAAVVARGVTLASRARERRPAVALSFNSYAQALAAAALRIPFVTVMDYEYQPANHLAFRLARTIIVPEGFDDRMLRRQGARPERVTVHPGLKEHVTLADFQPDPTFPDQLRSLGVLPEDILAVVRPPATQSAYHRFGDDFYLEVIDNLARRPGVKVVVLPRYESQAGLVRALGRANVVIPAAVLDGLNLVYWADLVVSGGGSMNREAVVLGTPAWTIFRGRMAGVDTRLIASGLMSNIRSAEELAAAAVEKKPAASQPDRRPEAIDAVVAGVLAAAPREGSAKDFDA